MAHDDLQYQAGFGNAQQSEALPGAVPELQNSPRRASYGLHPEQINGSSFTVPRGHNVRTWLYKIRPSVNHGEFAPLQHARFGTGYLGFPANPNLIGWKPRPLLETADDFIDGLETIGGCGDPNIERGLAMHTYVASTDMTDRAFYDADGDLMILPDTGALRIRTEFGWLRVEPGEFAVIQRGMKFSVFLEERPCRGLVAEIYARHFDLPDRGVIGANGLADERHFLSPVAAYEDREIGGGYRLVAKLGGSLFEARQRHSPYDVVGWHGNYTPYKYDLSRFNAMGTVTWDHPDPSIFTVLSAPLDERGENLADFVVFPSRWDVAKHTFRKPYYHRNAATEFNALVRGSSNADAVFTRGGIFVTPPFTAHGVGPEGVERDLRMSDDEADAPAYIGGSQMWVQLESTLPLSFCPWAMQSPQRATGFREFASGAPSLFDATRRDRGLPEE